MEGSAMEADLGANHDHFTRSSLTAPGSWKAAGVLPFAFRDGHCWLLLGAEMAHTGPQGKYRQMMWSDFGGQREAIDCDPEETASRECSEETLGMLFGCSSADELAIKCSTEALTQQLRSRTNSLRVVHPLRQGSYHMFVCQSRFVDPLMFQLATEQNDARASPLHGAEKTLFAWVRLADVVKAVARARKSYLFYANRRVVSRVPGQHVMPKKLLLHPCFAHSIRMAVSSGLVALVKACAKHGIAAPGDAAPSVMAASRACSVSGTAEAAAPSTKAVVDLGASLLHGLVATPQTVGDSPERPQDSLPGPLPVHMWWTLLQRDVAQQLDIQVPLEAARYTRMVQDEPEGACSGSNINFGHTNNVHA